MPRVIEALFGFDKHIIDIDLNGFTYQWSDYLGQHPLISCPCVFQAKQHYGLAVQSVWRNKGCSIVSTSGGCIGI